MSNNKDLDKELTESYLAKGKDLEQDTFPCLTNVPAGHFHDFVNKPKKQLPPEFVYISFDPNSRSRNDDEVNPAILAELLVAEWNMLWESGHLRVDLFRSKLPAELLWLTSFWNTNLYLLPDTGGSKYETFRVLYHLIPQRTLSFHKLPLISRGLWPPSMYHHLLQPLLTKDFDQRAAHAFAHHIWPLLCPGSSVVSFAKSDPLVLLAHNLNFWLPYAYRVAEERMQALGRADFDDAKQRAKYMKYRNKVPKTMTLERPLHGGHIWAGEQDAWEATKELVELADKQGQLRGIIDAVKSNRVQDDFSDRWSFAKEDFERRLYRKRAKIRVHFVEFDNAIPVHAPTSELDEDLLWEDFIALCDRKERRVVVCLKKGVTRVGEISKILGYTNHSPVSKTLANIRRKAKKYFDLS